MGSATKGDDSLSSSSSDQALSSKGWERFLPKRALRVLLVEEDISTRQIVKDLLHGCGYEVNCAVDGLEAWDMLVESNQVFDLVLADAMIAVAPGTDLLSKIALNDAHRDIPVIMMSAHDSLDMVFKCLMKGAKDFLVKPLRKNELRNLWQHVWRRNHAAGGSGRHGNAQGRKRKASRNISFGDTSNDNFSVSSDRNDTGAVKDENCSQEKESCPNLDCNQGSSFVHATTERADNFLCSEEGAGCSSTLERGDVSKKSSKAYDFFAHKKADFAMEKVPCEANQVPEILSSNNQCLMPSALELTLKHTSSTCNAGNDLTSKQGVRQSDCSAFSKYMSRPSLPKESCIVRSDSLPDHKSTNQCDLRGNCPHLSEACRSSFDICINSSDRLMMPIHCMSSTLHFPKATYFQHEKQSGREGGMMPSFCDESSRQVQDIALSTLWAPSLSSSTALPVAKTPLVESSALGHVNESNVGSAWCSTGSDKEDLSSNTLKPGDSYYKDSECMVLNMCTNNRLQPSTKSLDGEGFRNSKGDASFPELPLSTNVSGRGSNDGSDRGSNVIEEHLTQTAINYDAAQDTYSLTGWPSNENGKVDMDSNSTHAYGECNTTDQRLLAYDYRSSFRAAALHKFREKRKMRCFEKKVRYQSRKKLAEQRPRVKGQFVRRALPDMTNEMNTQP
ncbi:hypothetical protein KP509_04G094100 [Ceratopteris richardii]|uniref:Uncharacterized protein n=1 Tax=Ceratopteris richardii TaxID=49495 RepID=A0A8T2V797_CERRI|nr:hypothetical protein KP509_04G094100 [Ceratopteris richardii]